MCDNHQCQQREQIKWHESDGQSICQHAEKRRHQAGSEIGTGHLQTYNRLGLVRTEMIRFIQIGFKQGAVFNRDFFKF